MNLVLFESCELSRPLSRKDRRALHLLQVLRCREGDEFDAGVIDGLQGKGAIAGIEKDSISFRFHFDTAPAPLHPVTAIVGLSRPQSCRDMLRDATTLGVERLIFASTDRGEPSYEKSRLWVNLEYRRYLLLGAEQAFSTRLPQILLTTSIKNAIEQSRDQRIGALGSTCLSPEGHLEIALDNYESTGRLSEHLERSMPVSSVCLAIGSERGWSGEERELLRKHRFAIADLGTRVQRSETAIVAGVSLVLSAMRSM